VTSSSECSEVEASSCELSGESEEEEETKDEQRNSGRIGGGRQEHAFRMRYQGVTAAQRNEQLTRASRGARSRRIYGERRMRRSTSPDERDQSPHGPPWSPEGVRGRKLTAPADGYGSMPELMSCSSSSGEDAD
jgi:hypothetical protein